MGVVSEIFSTLEEEKSLQALEKDCYFNNTKLDMLATAATHLRTSQHAKCGAIIRRKVGSINHQQLFESLAQSTVYYTATPT